MNKTVTGLAGLVMLIALFFAINILSNNALKSARIDLTAARLYTLSDGARKIAQGIDEPINLTYYFSAKAAVDKPAIRAFGTRVREMLEEFAAESKGKIKLKIVNPEPYSDEEAQAGESGLEPQPINDKGDVLFFGLVGTNSTTGKELIPRFDPGSERLLEYDLAKIIYSLKSTDKKTIGLLGSVGLGGFTFDPQTRQPSQKPKWQAFVELEKSFKAEVLQPSITEVPANIDVLVLVHPKNLSDATLYAIDQFVMRGGRLMAFVDPLCQTDDSINARDQMQALMADRSSSINKLLEAWGVEVVPDKVVLDKTYAAVQQMQQKDRIVNVSLLQFLLLKDEAISKTDEVGRALETINTFFAGAIRAKPGFTGKKLTIDPILSASEESMLIDKGEVQFVQDPSQLIEKFIPGGEKLALAARLSGNVKSAFEAGPPTPAAAPGSPPPPAPDKSKHLAETKVAANVVLIADVDLLNDRAWLREMSMGKQRIFMPLASNGQLLTLGVENLTGSAELLSIRPRGASRRPFDKVESIRKDAEKQTIEKVKAAEDKLRKAEEKLTESLKEQTPSAENNFKVTPEQLEKYKELRQERLNAQRDLRLVMLERDRVIEKLGTAVKFLNIGLVPACVALLAVALGLYRSSRRAVAKA